MDYIGDSLLVEVFDPSTGKFNVVIYIRMNLFEAKHVKFLIRE